MSERSIKISKDRFMEALKPKGFNISSLSRELDKQFKSKKIKDTGFTHRALQNNLKEGKMSYQVLDNVCEILDCPVEYLTGEESISASSLGADIYRDFKEGNRIDKNGFLIRYYHGLIPSKETAKEISPAILKFIDNYSDMFVKAGYTNITSFIENHSVEIENEIYQCICKYIETHYDSEK